MKDLSESFERIAAGAGRRAALGDTLAAVLAETGRRRRRFAVTTVAAVGGVAAAAALVATLVPHAGEPLPPAHTTTPSPTPTAHVPASILPACGQSTAGLVATTAGPLVPSTFTSLDPTGWAFSVAVIGVGANRPEVTIDATAWVVAADGVVVAEGRLAPASPSPAPVTDEVAAYLDGQVSLDGLTDCRTGDPLRGPVDLWTASEVTSTDGATTTATLVAPPVWFTFDPEPVPARFPLAGEGATLPDGFRLIGEQQVGPGEWSVTLEGPDSSSYLTVRDTLLGAGFALTSAQATPAPDGDSVADWHGELTRDGDDLVVDVSVTGGGTYATIRVVAGSGGPGDGPPDPAPTSSDDVLPFARCWQVLDNGPAPSPELSLGPDPADRGPGARGASGAAIPLRLVLTSTEDWSDRAVSASIGLVDLLDETGVVVGAATDGLPTTVDLSMTPQSGGGSVATLQVSATFLGCPDGSDAIPAADYYARVTVTISDGTQTRWTVKVVPVTIL